MLMEQGNWIWHGMPRTGDMRRGAERLEENAACEEAGGRPSRRGSVMDPGGEEGWQLGACRLGWESRSRPRIGIRETWM